MRLNTRAIEILAAWSGLIGSFAVVAAIALT
jgi:hypothetical protein